MVAPQHSALVFPCATQYCCKDTRLLFQLLWQPRTEQIMLVVLTKIANVLCHCTTTDRVAQPEDRTQNGANMAPPNFQVGCLLRGRSSGGSHDRSFRLVQHGVFDSEQHGHLKICRSVSVDSVLCLSVLKEAWISEHNAGLMGRVGIRK